MAYQHVLIAVDLSEECHPVLQRALSWPAVTASEYR